MPKMTEDERAEARRSRMGFPEPVILVHGRALFDEEESIGDPPAAHSWPLDASMLFSPSVERFARLGLNSVNRTP